MTNHVITSAMAKVMFSSLSKVMFSSLSIALSVCLSVCLLATLRENGWTDFPECFRVDGTRNNWKHFQDVRLNPLNTGIFFPTFSEESMTHSSIAEKRLSGFSWNFQKRTDLTQGAILKHFRDVSVNPLNPGSINLFPGSVFVCNIMEKGVNGFSWNFYEMSRTTLEIIS